jgi:chlorite dismutase
VPLLVAFVGGSGGAWSVRRMDRVIGAPLEAVARVGVVERPGSAAAVGSGWVLRGVTSNERYVSRAEREALAAVQKPLGRRRSTHAALIPITKSATWWALAQDERARIFTEGSRHVAIGLEYLPAVARRLHHGRDLGEPFDFLTWFEYAPEHESRFDELVGRLRATEEWTYVEREVDIRLARA